MRDNKIQTPAELRAILGEGIVALIEGRINVAQANSVVGFSGEIHKSIRQEFDMRCYMANSMTIEQQSVVKEIIGGDDE